MMLRHRGRVLVADLDGTLRGDRRALDDLLLRLQEARIGLVVATGRPISSINQWCKRCEARGCLPRALICMLGTEIYAASPKRYELLGSWSDYVGERWDRRAVERATGRGNGLTAQGPSRQSEYKLSFLVEPSETGVVTVLRRRLHRDCPWAQVVFSHRRCVDIIPARAGKGAAVKYVMHEWALEADAVITCGDSDNDLDMIDGRLGVASILVGNAQLCTSVPRRPLLYRAGGKHARGVIEGLQRLGWL